MTAPGWIAAGGLVYLTAAGALAVQVGRWLGRASQQQTRTACGFASPLFLPSLRGFACGLPANHGGDHAAYIDGRRVASWPNRPVTKEDRHAQR